MTVGWSNFAVEQHRQGGGNSYFTISPQEVVNRVTSNWGGAVAGNGETTLNRKVLIPVESNGFYCAPRAKLVEGLPVKAEVKFRQAGEDPYIETYVEEEDARRLDALIIYPATKVDIVCYSVEALLENGGERSTNEPWEIVCILATTGEVEPMHPLTMARNFLEKPGGTKSVYSAQEFAEAIYYYSSQRGVKVKSGDSSLNQVLGNLLVSYGYLIDEELSRWVRKGVYHKCGHTFYVDKGVWRHVPHRDNNYSEGQSVESLKRHLDALTDAV